MKKKMFSVSIVIPNWNGRGLLEKNLPSVLEAAPLAQIIVSDDASADGSVGFLKKTFPTVEIVENKRQQGFAGNVNSGVAKATGDIVVLLNTDVRPERNFLIPLLTRFQDESVAAVGCLEKSHEKGDVILRGRGTARWERGFFVHRRGEVDQEDTAWVAGGSAAYRKTVWDKLGGMDTLYNPFYWEDIDLSYQILKSGYTIRFENKSIVHHYHEEGKIATSYSPNEVKQIAYRNQFLFLWKNISDMKLRFSYGFWMPIRLMQAIMRGDINFIIGFMLLFPRLPLVIARHFSAARHWKLRDLEIFPS